MKGQAHVVQSSSFYLKYCSALQKQYHLASDYLCWLSCQTNTELIVVPVHKKGTLAFRSPLFSKQHHSGLAWVAFQRHSVGGSGWICSGCSARALQEHRYCCSGTGAVTHGELKAVNSLAVKNTRPNAGFITNFVTHWYFHQLIQALTKKRPTDHWPWNPPYCSKNIY